MRVIAGNDRKEYKSLSYADLFNPNKSRILFDDLTKLIKKNWDCFNHIFGQDNADFEAKMKTVNELRADAHAKLISNEAFSHFRVCISAIEDYVDEFLD